MIVLEMVFVATMIINGVFTISFQIKLNCSEIFGTHMRSRLTAMPKMSNVLYFFEKISKLSKLSKLLKKKVALDFP